MTQTFEQWLAELRDLAGARDLRFLLGDVPEDVLELRELFDSRLTAPEALEELARDCLGD